MARAQVQAKGVPANVVRLDAPAAHWPTPGSALAERLAGIPELRLVVERFESSGYVVTVVLERDPEAVLDQVYEAEKELYSAFTKIPFDVRVMTPGEGWTEESLLANGILRYERLKPR